MAIVDYLAFEHKQVYKEVRYAFDPIATPETLLHHIFKPTTQKIIGIENTDKQDLKDQIFHLLNAAAIIRAVFFNKLPNNQADATAAVKQTLTTTEETEQNEDSFDQFTELVETQFGNIPGANPDNGLQPYGREYDRRPRVREIGKDQDG